MSELFRTTLFVMTAIAIPLSGFFLAATLIISTQGWLVGMPLALLYTVVFVLLLRVSPLWPSKRTTVGLSGRSVTLWACVSLLWGGFVAFGLALAAGEPLMSITNKLGWDVASASLSGAYPEEFSKALGVLFVMLSFRFLNRPWHGLVTGALVGLGFEINENLMYGVIGALYDPSSDIHGALTMWGYRSVLGLGLHVGLSAIAGWGIGYALCPPITDRTERLSTPRRLAIGAFWLLMAFMGHFWWNLQLDNQVLAGISIAGAGLYIYGLVIGLVVHAWKMCTRDHSYALLELHGQYSPHYVPPVPACAET